jgi:hypothetical protein
VNETPIFGEVVELGWSRGLLDWIVSSTISDNMLREIRKRPLVFDLDQTIQLKVYGPFGSVNESILKGMTTL